MGQHHTTSNHPLRIGSTWGLWTLAALGLVMLANALGATWLTAPILSVPLGVWCVGIGLGVAAILSQRWPGLTKADLAVWATPQIRRITDIASAAFLWLLKTLLGEDRAIRIERSLCARLDRTPWWSTPLRVGLDVSPTLAQDIMQAPGLSTVRWLEVTHDQARDDPNAFCEQHALDAVVFALPNGGLRIVTLRRRGLDASLPDWSFDRPVTLGTLFPHRIDPGVVEIGRASVQLQRAMIDAAVVMTRLPSRLGLADRLAGRRAIDGKATHRAVRPIEQAKADTPAQVMAALLEAAGAEGVFESYAAQTAIRAASAWAASTPLTRRAVDDHAQRELLERAAQLAPTSLSTRLRLAAARFAVLDDKGGLDELAVSYELLRTQRVIRDNTVDAAFLDEALRESPDNSTSVGKVAAGLTLLIGSTPPDQLNYLRDDLLDEARYADWLIGRDPDTTLLDMVFRRLSLGHASDAAGRFPRRAA